MGLPDESLEVDNGASLAGIEAGDVFLLCSDGLWEYIDDSMLESSLTIAAAPAAWLDNLASCRPSLWQTLSFCAMTFQCARPLMT